MLLPPFLLVADDAGRVQEMTAMLTRIGLANEVRVSPTLSDAKAYLGGCATSRLPVIVLTRAIVGEETGVALIEWMRGQADAIAGLDVIALVDEAGAVACTGAEELGATLVSEPVEMRALIAAMKSLALPEQPRIDPATLMVRVELWPRPGGVSRQ